MTDAHGIARDQLRAFIERIERLEEEKKTIADDIKDVYAEAKGMGFIPAMMKKVIALRKKDELERMEEGAILDTYLHALGMIAQPDLFEEPHHPETGELIDPKLAQTIVTGMQTEIGRKALIAAVDIMIAREEAEDNSPETAIGETGMVLGTGRERPLSIGLHTDGYPEARFETVSLHQNSENETASQGEAVAPPNGSSDDMEEAASEISADERKSPIDGLSGEGASIGGDHVTASENAAVTAGAPVTSAPATKHRFRPNCQHRDHCKSGTADHCHSCKKAMREEEAA